MLVRPVRLRNRFASKRLLFQRASLDGIDISALRHVNSKSHSVLVKAWVDSFLPLFSMSTVPIEDSDEFALK